MKANLKETLLHKVKKEI